MPTYYVDSNATGGANDGTSKANAFLTFGQAVSVAVAGDTIYLSHLHNEGLTANQNYRLVGSFLAPIYVTSIDFGTDAPTAGAYFDGRVNGSYNIHLDFNCVFAYGLIFVAGNDVTWDGDKDTYCYYTRCTFDSDKPYDTTYQYGSTGYYVCCDQCTLMAGYDAFTLGYGALTLDWYGGEILGNFTTLVTARADFGGSNNAILRFYGVDFTGSTGLTTLAYCTRAGNSGTPAILLKLVGCKLPQTVTAAGAINKTSSGYYRDSVEVEVLPASQGELTSPDYRYLWASRGGWCDTVLTHYRASGADDGFQANPFSQKLSSRPDYSLKGLVGVKFPLSTYIEAVGGAKTLKIHFAHAGVGSGPGGVVQNDELIAIVTGPSDEVSPNVGKFIKSYTIGDTVADLPTEPGESWSGANPLLTVKQSLSVSYTPTIEGLVNIILIWCPGGATQKDIFVCPKIEVTP